MASLSFLNNYKRDTMIANRRINNIYSLTSDNAKKTLNEIFDSYKESISKNGTLQTYQSISELINVTKTEAMAALDKVEEEEKWFDKGLDFITKNGPFREDRTKKDPVLNEVNLGFKPIDFKYYQTKEEDRTFIDLSYMLHFLNYYSSFFNKVTWPGFQENYKSFKEAFNHFEKSHLTYAYLQELKHQIQINGICQELEKELFYGEISKLVEEGNKEVSQGRPHDKSAPQHKIVDFIRETLLKAEKGEPGFKVYIHQDNQHEGKPNKSQLISALFKENLTGKLAKETVKDRVNKALKELGY